MINAVVWGPNRCGVEDSGIAECVIDGRVSVADSWVCDDNCEWEWVGVSSASSVRLTTIDQCSNSNSFSAFCCISATIWFVRSSISRCVFICMTPTSACSLIFSNPDFHITSLAGPRLGAMDHETWGLIGILDVVGVDRALTFWAKLRAGGKVSWSNWCTESPIADFFHPGCLMTADACCSSFQLPKYGHVMPWGGTGSGASLHPGLSISLLSAVKWNIWIWGIANCWMNSWMSMANGSHDGGMVEVRWLRNCSERYDDTLINSGTTGDAGAIWPLWVRKADTAPE